MNVDKLKAKFKDWEDRFFEKYKRPATREDIKKYPKVERVYQDIKENTEIMKPSPFKQASKGLFKSLSLTNVNQSRPKPFLKRLSETIDSPRKKCVPNFLENVSTVMVENVIEKSAKGSDMRLEKNDFESVFDSQNIVRNSVEDQSETMVANSEKQSENVPRTTDGDLPVHYTGFTKQAIDTKDAVTIELDDNKGKADRLVIRKLIGDFTKKPVARQWASSPKLTNSHVFFTQKPPLPVQKSENFVVPPPGRFSNSRALKRQNSLTLGELPKNYRDFLSREEVEKFANVIGDFEKVGDNGAGAGVAEKEVVLDEPKLSNIPAPKEPLLEPAPNTKKEMKPRTSKTVVHESSQDDDSLDEEYAEQEAPKAVKKNTKASSRSKKSKSRIQDSEDDSMDDNESDEAPKAKPKPKKESKKKSVPKRLDEKSKNDFGWSSKNVNENYRAMKLKPKKGGGTKSHSKKSKFHKTKTLSSYTYTASDGQYLLAGYKEQDITLDDAQLEKLDDKNVSLDFLTSSSDSVCISEVYGAKDVFVDVKGALKSLTGFDAFRDGQQNVIERILKAQSTLFILPTGGGKSLCYQLPVFILRHAQKQEHLMAIVVTPTLSLMFDQLRCLFPGIRGACLSSADSSARAQSTISKIKKHMIDVLFVSPERVRADSFTDLVNSPGFPKISFACIDEVHCISEWSHNFRTSYLHLQSCLLKSLNVKCVLGLTGTVTTASKETICAMLDIEADGVISYGLLRPNLHITVSQISNDDNRENALLDLLKMEPFKNHKSIIVYVMFQYQADKLSQFLRIRQVDADSYHAGKSQEERNQVQGRFIRGNLRVIIATVAFGMGINKMDVDAVIHYCMPKSIESYIQEIGRAGRDGRDAYCHLFLAREDYIKHRSLVFSEHANEKDIKRFLEKIFDSKNGFVGIDVIQAERDFDIKEAVMATILSYIEIRYPELLLKSSVGQGLYTVYFGSGVTIDTIQNDAAFFSQICRIANVKKNCVEFDIADAVNETKMDYKQLTQSLWELQTQKKIRFKSELKSYLLKVDASQVDSSFINSLKKDLFRHLDKLERVSVLKMDEIYEALFESSFGSTTLALTASPEELGTRRSKLSTRILDYFTRSASEETAETLEKSLGFRDSVLVENQRNSAVNLEVSIKQFIRSYSEVDNGRAIARIFHSISSPKYTAFEWSTNEYWGKFTHVNFNDISRKATKALDMYHQKMNGLTAS